MAIVVKVLVSQILITFVSNITKPCFGGNSIYPPRKLMTVSCRVPLKLLTMIVYGVVLMKL